MSLVFKSLVELAGQFQPVQVRWNDCDIEGNSLLDIYKTLPEQWKVAIPMPIEFGAGEFLNHHIFLRSVTISWLVTLPSPQCAG